MRGSSCLEMPSIGERGNHIPAQRLMDEWNREQSAEITPWGKKATDKSDALYCVVRKRELLMFYNVWVSY